MKKKPVSTTKANLKKIQLLVANPTLRSVTERRAQKTPRFPEGSYYRIIVRPRSNFIKFKSESMSGNGMLQQIHGQLPDKRWTTHAWLIDKRGAVEQGNTLQSIAAPVTHLFRVLNKPISHVEKDVYEITH